MDRFDRIALLFLLIVLVAVGGLLVGPRHSENSRNLRKTGPAGALTKDPALGKKLQIARELLLAGNLTKAEALIKSLEEQYPYEGQVYMLMGDYYIHQQQPISAMLEHRKAIELNPDFLDKNTADFQGKKIRNNVKEAQLLIEQGMRREPQNEKWQKYREAMYYMQRRIAGSCS